MTDLRSSIERSVRLLEPGGRLEHVGRLPGGVSAEVHRLDIVTEAGERRRVVFRQHRTVDFKSSRHSIAAKEYDLMAILHRAGFPVPEPLLLGDRNGAATPFLLTEWISGSTAVTTTERASALEQMAQFLAELHSLDPKSLPIGLLQPVEDPRSAIEAYVPDTEIRSDILGIVSHRAPDPHRPVLLHGDYWPGNVMWQAGSLAAVLDWEDACLGSPLADLAGARVELLGEYGEDAMEQFTARYLELIATMAAPLELEHLPLWEVYVSAAALSTMHTWGLERDDEAHRRRVTEQFFNRAAEELR